MKHVRQINSNQTTSRTAAVSASTQYRIQHETRFRYEDPVSESIMELRMEPLMDGRQRMRSFSVSVQPAATVQSYVDGYGNKVSFFDVPGKHSELRVITEVEVECRPTVGLPSALTPHAWRELDTLGEDLAFWDYLAPSHFAKPTELLEALAEEIGLGRDSDPLTALMGLNSAVYERFTYLPETTDVNSPIDMALEERKGVCQDFAHIMIALVRRLGIPCRYVSGYLYHREDEDRSAEDASHAWVEAFLPGIGWVGLDPTNNLRADDRHIRVAIGRDYADVPPTKGVFRGESDTELEVAVQVMRIEEDEPEMPSLLPDTRWVPAVDHYPRSNQQQQQQQQQQQ